MRSRSDVCFQINQNVRQELTWLSNNLNTPFLISNIQKYTKLGALLLTSKYFRTVDYRIMAYLELFGIAGQLT